MNIRDGGKSGCTQLGVRRVLHAMVNPLKLFDLEVFLQLDCHLAVLAQ
jgi:hypothetical protein